ncbi:serine/threonine protein kinase [Hyalangium rubrum]|uniref:Protein kinase n=1 Tax=Hyalangium rubrum TaxID=3103134 RepID=A0ABU5HDI5_9BACT|nr:protein kinase [Hyalangium sp. s54d21]MDY7230877.1 protein kinase [Hyalangium sp. s54d21]
MPRQAEASGVDPYRGRKIGKYEILTRHSVGGMAELFLAFTSGPGGFRKFVALKQILPDVKTDEFVRMFLDEARITAAFSHANIGQVFELGEEDGELYLAMEFLPGQNLEQVMVASSYGNPVPVGFAARVVRDVCLGLHYAHHFTAPSGRKVAVVHRDLAPRNVMVTYDGVVKVIDFGIAKARGRLNRTAVGMVKGTSGYMSPEQVRNQELDGRSDLFCAGVLLHELLSGQRLYNTMDEDAMMRQIAHSDAPSPRTFNPEVSEALESVVMRALARDPARRFSTGREMAKAIEQAMGSELFDEEAVAALMQSLFAEKRQKTLALLDYEEESISRENPIPARHTLEDPSDIEPTNPMPALPFQETLPPRSAAPRQAVPGARPFPRKQGAAGEPSSPVRARPPSGRQMPEAPSRRPPTPDEEAEATQVSPPAAVKAARPEPEGRRPARMGVFTLGPSEPPTPSKSEEREDSEVSEVSRVSRVSQALQSMDRPTRRGMWLILVVVLAGIVILFLPEALKSRLGALFSSAGSWMSDRLSATSESQAEPSAPSPMPATGVAAPSQDAYEPPPPGEGSAAPEEPAPEQAPVNAATPAPSEEKPPKPRKAEPSTPPTTAPAATKPPPAAAKKPAPPAAVKKPEETEATEETGELEESAEAPEEAAAPPPPAPKPSKAPAIQGKPEVPAKKPVEEEVLEPAEPSVGPAEVDPSIQPLELSPPTSPEGEP